MRRAFAALLLAALVLLLTGCDYIVVENKENVQVVGTIDNARNTKDDTAFDPFD